MKLQKEKVILTGFRATGKSSAGKIRAKQLDFDSAAADKTADKFWLPFPHRTEAPPVRSPVGVDKPKRKFEGYNSGSPVSAMHDYGTG